jgi:hypothetical protein
VQLTLLVLADSQQGKRMKVKKLGSDTRVTVSQSEVEYFKSKWPCSGLPDKAISFIFESNGDLVDIFGVNEKNDCGEALLALSQDAKKLIDKSK